MENDPDILLAARSAIARFGPRAADIMEERARNHSKSGDKEGEEFWKRVAAAVREIAKGGTA